MKKTLLKLFTAAMATVMTVACFSACGGNKSGSYTANNTEYYFGASGPLTGAAGVYGNAVKNGASLAVKEINDKGGIDGIKINFNMYDDKHDQTTVANGYASQLEAGMQVSLGCVTTKPCLQYKALSKDDNVFFITPSATADSVVEFNNAYQMCFSDSTQGSASAKYVTENVGSDVQIGVFYKSDDDYSKGIYNKFISEFKSELGYTFNGKEVKIASFNDDNATDFTAQVEILKDCKFIFMPIYYAPAATFIKAAMGKIADDAIYFGGDGLDGVETELGDTFSSVTQGIYYISHFDSKATTGKAGDFIKNYKEAYDSDPIQFAASAYDCVYALADAISYAKNTLKRDVPVTISASDMCEILKEVFQDDGFSVSGVTGTDMKWNADGTVNTSTKVVSEYVIKEVSQLLG